MSTTVSVTVSKGSGKVCEFEVSGGQSGDLGNGTTSYTIGASGAVVAMLNLKRLGAGSIKIKAVSGGMYVSLDNGKDKKVSKGGSVTMSSKNQRALVREA